MSKSRQRFDNQLSILDLLRGLSEQSEKPATEGQFRCVDRMRAAMRSAIRNSPLSRHQIAGEMSHLLGQTITKEQVDSWTREDREIPPDPPLQKGGDRGALQKGEYNGEARRIRRHIPAEYLPAFCEVTHCHEPLRLLGELVGLFVLPGPEALRAEIQRLDEQAKELQARKKKRVIFLREMERGAQ